VAGTQTVKVMVSYEVPLHSVLVNPQEIEITVIETEQEEIDE